MALLYSNIPLTIGDKIFNGSEDIVIKAYKSRSVWHKLTSLIPDNADTNHRSKVPVSITIADNKDSVNYYTEFKISVAPSSVPNRILASTILSREDFMNMLSTNSAPTNGYHQCMYYESTSDIYFGGILWTGLKNETPAGIVYQCWLYINTNTKIYISTR